MINFNIFNAAKIARNHLHSEVRITTFYDNLGYHVRLSIIVDNVVINDEFILSEEEQEYCDINVFNGKFYKSIHKLEVAKEENCANK